MKKVVVMGGSFNPPTVAHQKMLIYVVEQLGADKGVFVPSPYSYVYAKMERVGMPEEAIPDDVRIKMLRAICEEDPRLLVDDIECKNPENWYTTETMNYMQEKYPDSHITCLGGADRVRGYINAYRFIPFTDKYSYTVVTRGDDDPIAILKEKPEAWERRDRFNIISAPSGLEGISSSAIRNKLRSGDMSAKDMCHPKVWELLMEYRNKKGK